MIHVQKKPKKKKKNKTLALLSRSLWSMEGDRSVNEPGY